MYTSPTSSSYGSPPPPPHNPYRSSPVAMAPRQPYTFSPPPQLPQQSQMGYNMPQQQSRYNQYPAQRSQVPNMPNRYQSPVPQQPSQLPPARHKGTLAPGQIVKVGDASVRIERYLSEGGYAHVYLTTSEKPIYPPYKGEKKGRWGERGFTQHCLKRIAFQDESVWADVKKEIEVMKSLPPSPHLTQYLGSAHSKLAKGGYEVFILMEFCAGGGIIDLLNKRLRDRLKEIEILNIFTDVCEAVAAMHALSRPLLHRDLKIENVLSSPSGASPTPQRPTPLTFKLCDFGSTTFPSAQPPKSKLESDALALDLNKHTTLQYRSPEMVEPMLGWAVGLPSDVWALGVLLYKLCYYTTPFEEHGTLAIVNAKYTFPQYPVYSPHLQHLIASMLLEQPTRRPSVFEVLKVAHDMSGTKPEIEYAASSRSFASPPSQTSKQASTSSNLLDFTSPTSSMDRSGPIMQPSLASTVQPQRRGRPTREPSEQSVQTTSQAQPSQSPGPMPVPPTIHHVQPTPPAAMTLQVSGGQRPTPAPKSTGSVDAFGVSSRSSAPQKISSGFGDAFGASSSRFGSSLHRPMSGFGDSFAKSPNSSLGSKQSGTSPTHQFPTSFGGPRSASPAVMSDARKSPGSTSVPDGEVSFETRFPSIERLSSSETFSSDATTSRADSTTPQLISPMFSPPAERKPGLMGSLTGGEKANNHLAPGGIPQPRSNHVTGTAFKGIQGGLLSPTSPSTSTKQSYFDAIERKPLIPADTNGQASSPGPTDLMTGDINETMTSERPPLSRKGSSISKSPANAGFAKMPPATGHSRPLLPHIDSQRPSSNIDSESWSPLEKLKRASSTQPATADSSDDDNDGPEDAAAAYRPLEGPSPSSPDRKSAVDMPKAPPVAEQAALPQASEKASISTGSGRGRPVSMYALPSTSSRAVVSPPNSASQLQTPSDRPQHVRKGSINDIVSRYENMKPPGFGPSSSSSSISTANGPAKKPTVAAKPATLRQPTKEAETIQQPTSPIKAPRPQVAAKPALLKPEGVRYEPGPRPSHFSKSSSGRSFPTSRTMSEIATQEKVEEPTPSVKSNGSSSPDKQQSVNSLIARWNQGQVSGEKKAPIKRKYI